MQEKDIVSSVYFEDRERFADLINAYVFDGEQVVKEEDIKEINCTKARVMKSGKTLFAQKVTADVAGNILSWRIFRRIFSLCLDFSRERMTRKH